MSGAARMAGWAGFSADELRRMRSRRELPDPKDPGACPPEAFLSCQQPQGKKVPVQRLAKQDKVPVAQQDHSSSIKQNTTTENLPGSTQVTKPLEETPKQPVVDNKEVTSESPSMRAKEDEELSKKDVELSQPCPIGASYKDAEEQLSRREKTRLEQLQLEQRLMEEKNKRKKALLAKAIAERSKRTQAEAVKLNKIQKQLQALDEMVSTDIGILRNRIEQACIEFSQAKKRYDKAESEYVSAKLDFYKKTQIKEQLTEHLCTIIQQNELRKAKKLEELMQQLEVEADEERLDLEIEVEQILQLQEAEAKKQLVPSASDKSQRVLNPDSIESPSEKESSAESQSAQSKAGVTLNDLPTITTSDTTWP
ncbi:RAB6-interacting golgin isoform X1 [Ranitomeya variabilis]|uniref:RAB6-interacting golgin isoform X1 n=1 Tax=Ranitomeya variabilis TaxID=490064 RepID=UPI004056DC8A